MNKAHGSARSEDCASLKDRGLTYIAIDMPGGLLMPPIPPHLDKASMRGFKHIALACLLCPMRLLSDFDADPAE
jgi:hypothetical protein